MRTKSTTQEDISPRIKCTSYWRLKKVKPLPDYILEVEFLDGTQGIVDMSRIITSKKAGVFAKLRDLALFNQVSLHYSAVTWPGEIDLAPDAMYEEIKRHGKWILA